VTIHLSDLPGGAACAAGGLPRPHFWPCSRWGLPSHLGHPKCWCALTAPFHPYLYSPPRREASHRRSVFCGTVLRVTSSGR